MNRKLWENLLSLYVVKFFTYLLPLFTLPFLTRILGAEHWGQLAFAEAYANYVSLVIEYGFGLSGSRDVAQNQNNLMERSKQLSDILGAQAILSVVLAITSTAAALLIPSFKQYRELLPIAFALAVLRSATPIWYYQGLERMRFISALTVSTNMLAAVLTLVFVRSDGDVAVPLVLRTIAALVATAIALILALRELPLAIPTYVGAISALRRGFSLFLFKSVVSLYTAGNVILLGMLAPATAVAYFAGAEKLVKSALNTIEPITQAFYPRINSLLKSDQARAARVARTSLLLTVGVGVALFIGLELTATLTVPLLLGGQFRASISVLRVLALLPPLIAASNALGIQWMLSLRLDSTFAWITFIAGAANVALAVYLVPRYQQLGMATSVVIAELIVTAGVVFALHRKGLTPWKKIHFGSKLIYET